VKKEFRIGILERLQSTIHSLSFVERVILYTFVGLLFFSSIGLLAILNNKLLITVPAPGGAVVEGVVGTPRFINPVLALSDADRDLTTLLYSGLMRATPEGELIPDLAKTVSISDDGLTYTFTLKNNITFHNGELVTAADVVFTIKLAQNADVKSPKRANWEGVRVEALDKQTVQFTLAQTYAPFLENTTMGILPEHRWKDIPPEQLIFTTYNTEPVGSGPFVFVKAKRDSAGIPKEYELKRFDNYALGAPYLEIILLRFYPNEIELIRAFERGNVEHINSIGPEHLAEINTQNTIINTAPLPRIFGVFFNQDETSLFTSDVVREALTLAIDRDRLVEEVLGGYGTPTTDPLPTELSRSLFGTLTSSENTHPDYKKALALLTEAGWKQDPESGTLIQETDDETREFRFSLATSNNPELKRVAEIIQEEWAKIGIQVDLEFYEISSLNQEIIRPRNYQALLFGQIIGRDLDPFAFWHSSQREDPGLNIALYANITVDEALEEIRTTFDPDKLAKLYETFETEIQNDVPAVFLYSPEFIYLTKNNLKGIARGTITTPAERFLNAHEWHIFTQRVWGFLSD